MSFLRYINKFNEVSEISVRNDSSGAFYDYYCECNNTEHQTKATFAHNAILNIAHKETKAVVPEPDNLVISKAPAPEPEPKPEQKSEPDTAKDPEENNSEEKEYESLKRGSLN